MTLITNQRPVKMSLDERQGLALPAHIWEGYVTLRPFHLLGLLDQYIPMLPSKAKEKIHM